MVPLAVVSVPVPVFRLMLTSVLAKTGTTLTPASCDWTTREKGVPAVGFVPPLTDVIASFEAAPATTVNGALAPADAAGPLVLVAVITTPVSALVYVTPLTVVVFCPMTMVPLSVPPSVPVPAVLEKENTRFEPVTLLGFPPASCDWTTTGKPAPATGLVPPLTDVIASLATVPTVMLIALLGALVIVPLVAVSV